MSALLGRKGRLRLADIAGAYRNRAQAVAIYLDRQGMARIADQQRLRTQRIRARDLPDDTLRIQQSLAGKYVVARAFVKNDFLPERIEVNGHDLCNQHAVGHPCGGFHQRTQARVFCFQSGESLQACVVFKLLQSQLFVIVDELRAFRQIATYPVADGERQVNERTYRIDRHRQHLSEAIEMILAMVEDHQRNGKKSEQE